MKRLAVVLVLTLAAAGFSAAGYFFRGGRLPVKVTAGPSVDEDTGELVPEESSNAEKVGITGSLVVTFEPTAEELGYYGVSVRRSWCSELGVGYSVASVLDSKGNVLGSGTTGRPYLTSAPSESNPYVDRAGCAVDFAIEASESPLMRFDVGGIGGPTYTLQQLERIDFSVELTYVISAANFLPY